MIGLLFQLFAARADGQVYLSRPRAAIHSLTKTAASAAMYEGLRRLHIGTKAEQLLLSTVGVWALAKGIERAKGHTLGPWDAVNDLAAHSLLVVPIASGRRGPSIAVGLVWIGTCRRSSPRWC